mmetsp:Transcript_35514/g.81997  ORF Transcript_35514/g.81997 Transcript_35514/m.81997 type:complete len:530 (+) Transcript_35514:50-1639(+)
MQREAFPDDWEPFRVPTPGSEFRRTALLYQTDGWEPFKDEEVEELLTRPREPKPWHVPDEDIQAMVKEVGAREGVSQALLQHAKVRRPRDDGEALASILQAYADNTPRAQEAAGEAEAPAPELRSSLRRRSSVGKSRSVRFEEAETEDALDRMIRTVKEESFAKLSNAEEEDGTKKKKPWKISDDDFRDFVLSLARSDAEVAPASAPALASSASAPVLRGGRGLDQVQGSKDAKINVQVYFLDSQDVMTLRVSPELRIGPAQPPKGNRFTDIYGLGANTKGFAEFKKFDYQRRQWLGGFRREWVPAWSQSLKGIIHDLTGMEIARQKLFWRNVPMNNDNLTLRSWGVKDGDGVQLRFQQKISPQQLEAMRKACQATTASGGDVEKCIASVMDPSLPVKTDMESSTASDFFKPRRRREESVEPRRQSAKASKAAQERMMLKEEATTAHLRNSRHLKRCKSKGDVWMMPRWISNPATGHFSPIGNPKTTVDNREPSSFAEKSIYLADAYNMDVRRVRTTVTGNPLYTKSDS